VFNVLLQVLDDGRLTDGHGRTVDFRNTIIAMTSNIGSEYISNVAADLPVGRGERRTDEATEQRREERADAALDPSTLEIELRVKEELKRHFRPEFLNRVDETVVFHRLSRRDLRGIVDLQVRTLQRRLASANLGGGAGVSLAINLTLTDAAKDQLARDGYDPVYGARPLKRLIQQQIENPLAKRILNGDFAPGDAIEVDAGGEAYVFTRRAA